MALRTTYTDANLVIDEGLDVYYSSKTIQGDWTYAAGVSIVHLYTMVERHRYATKSFRYVGMNYETAVSCRNAMRAKFARTVYSSFWEGGGWSRVYSGTMPMASVQILPDGGDAYSVVVNVSEDDVLYHKVGSGMEIDFTQEKTRKYGSDGHGTADEGEPQ